MRIRLGSLLAVLGLGASMSASSAPNLLANPGFDTDLSSWLLVNDSNSQASFDPTLDANSSPSSGSVKLQKFSGQPCIPNVYQCVSVSAGKPYDFGGSVYIPIGQGPGIDAFVSLAWFSNANCSGTRVGAPAAGPFLPTGAWSSATSSVVAPAGTHSAAINMTACQVVGNPVTANYDNLFVQAGPVLPPPFIDLILIVEGPIHVSPGGPVEYRLVVKNASAVAALGIRVGVYLPTGLAGLVAAGGGTYDSAQGWLSWPLFDHIDPGGEQVFSFTLPRPVAATGNAVVAMLNGDSDYSNNAVAFSLAPNTGEPVPALATLALAMLVLLLAVAGGAALRCRARA